MNTNTTKSERRKLELANHYAFLERFSEFLGKKQDGKKLSLKLLRLEREANKAATDYCNGDIDSDTWDLCTKRMRMAVPKAFEVKNVPGLIINGDARGYTLKIDDAFVRDHYPAEIKFHRDWGGYGILSPEIEVA